MADTALAEMADIEAAQTALLSPTKRKRSGNSPSRPERRKKARHVAAAKLQARKGAAREEAMAAEAQGKGALPDTEEEVKEEEEVQQEEESDLEMTAVAAENDDDDDDDAPVPAGGEEQAKEEDEENEEEEADDATPQERPFSSYSLEECWAYLMGGQWQQGGEQEPWADGGWQQLGDEQEPRAQEWEAYLQRVDGSQEQDQEEVYEEPQQEEQKAPETAPTKKPEAKSKWQIREEKMAEVWQEKIAEALASGVKVEEGEEYDAEVEGMAQPVRTPPWRKSQAKSGAPKAKPKVPFMRPASKVMQKPVGMRAFRL